MDDTTKTEGSQPTKVRETWFIQRGQNPDDIFACDEQEAWGLFHNRTNWMRRDFKIIGVSDGKTYVRIIKESGQKRTQLEERVKQLSADLTRYMHTQDKFKFEDLLPDTDEKVVKIKAITEKLQKEIDEVNAQLQSIHSTIVKEAFDAELAIARGNIKHPTNHDVFTPAGNRDKILQNLGK